MGAVTPANGLNGGHSLTSFVGRRRELAEVRELMSRSRLLTLVGPGGVGKTRLSVELSTRLQKAFSDGVWIVELAELEDASLVGAQIAAALKIPDRSNRSPIQRIVDYVRGRHLLLILDNCEHHLDEVSSIAAGLLDIAPKLRIVATSREPLGLLGEQVYNVPPLTSPQEFMEGRGSLETFESVRLLLDRARSIDPKFEITDGNRLAVAQLCQRLEGIPLAIELAAARLRSISVVQLVERLEHRFDILTGGSRAALPRQQTLRALVDWSYELCSEHERLLWGRLAVFPAGFDLQAAEEVCGFGVLQRSDVLDLIDHLVAKSLLIAENTTDSQSGGTVRVRYRQLMTFREYGAELLEKNGESTVMRRRQRDHYLARAEATVDDWYGPHQAELLSSSQRDHANLLSALEWSASTQGEEHAGLHFAALLRYHWTAGGYLSDGRRWLDRMLNLESNSSSERASALWVAAWICLVQGDRMPAQSYLAECREIAQALNDPVLAAHAEQWEAVSLVLDGQLERAIMLFTAALVVHRRVGDTASALYTLFLLGWAQKYAGRVEEALIACREVLELSIKKEERWARSYGHAVMGLCQWQAGDLEVARQSQISVLEIQQEFPDGLCIALTIEQMSWTAASGGHYESAAILHHAAQSVWRGIGTTISVFGPVEKDFEQMTTLIQRELGKSQLEAIYSDLPEPSQSEAIMLALKVARSAYISSNSLRDTRNETSSVSGATKTPVLKSQGQNGGLKLTKREIQIATLVAEGLSNKEIAANLVISHRTVGGHVERILAKQGFTSRAQIASWVAGGLS